MRKVLFLPALVFGLSISSQAQVFVGSGYAEASFFGSSALDEGTGFTLLLEKDYDLSESGRLKIHPGINISFLYSNLSRNGFPSYLNIMSLSPKVSYEIISKEKLKIAPFANPFTSFLLGLQSDDFNFESEEINLFKWGLEGGLRVDFIIGKTTIRLIPLSTQRSIEDFYRQGMISLMISI